MKSRVGQAALDGQLWGAAVKGDAAAIERLAAEGASPDAKNSWGNPAVKTAVGNEHVGAVSALAGLGADLDARDRDGWTALMATALHGYVECARALLAGGADRTLRCTSWPHEGKTALEIAEANGVAVVAPSTSRRIWARPRWRRCCANERPLLPLPSPNPLSSLSSYD